MKQHMTADGLLTGSSVLIPLDEYVELLNLRKEVEQLKGEVERLNRENYGLKTTNKNLNEKIAKEHGYRRWNE